MTPTSHKLIYLLAKLSIVFMAVYAVWVAVGIVKTP